MATFLPTAAKAVGHPLVGRWLQLDPTVTMPLGLITGGAFILQLTIMKRTRSRRLSHSFQGAPIILALASWSMGVLRPNSLSM